MTAFNTAIKAAEANAQRRIKALAQAINATSYEALNACYSVQAEDLCTAACNIRDAGVTRRDMFGYAELFGAVLHGKKGHASSAIATAAEQAFEAFDAALLDY